MPGDDLVGEIIVYYKPPGGEEGSSFSVGGEYGVDFGHVFVEVRDLRTGENHYLDIWEENGQAHINRELDDTRRSEFESVNWGITESQLAGAVQAIEERLSSSTPYGVLDGSCVDSVGEVMRGAGYEVPDRWFPSDFWSEIQDISDANQGSATSPTDSPEHNISDGEGRYVPPPNTSESQQDSTPSDANICSPDGHETHIDFSESGQNLTPHDATISSSDGYEIRADSPSSISSPTSYDPSSDVGHSYTPSDANYSDPSGQSSGEWGSESSGSMSSPASYDPSSDDGHSYTPSGANYSDPSGHSSGEWGSESSGSMGSPASYDPSSDDGHSYTPSGANYSDPSGHSSQEWGSESSGSMSSPASYDPSSDDGHSNTPSGANYSDPSGHSSHEGWSEGLI